MNDLPEAVSVTACKCTLAQSLVGDGCRVCQPDTYMDMLEVHLKEADKRIAELEEQVNYYINAAEYWHDKSEGGGDE